MNRVEWVKSLDPSSGIAVEVGVGDGDFSFEILANTKFYLYSIDCWEFNAFNANPERSYTSTINKLKQFEGRSTIIKGYSKEVSNRFDPESLDFIYIDGDHTYEGVKSDLSCWIDKVKKGGIISGHDYCDRDWPGVIRAVAEFFESVNLIDSGANGDGGKNLGMSKNNIGVMGIGKLGLCFSLVLANSGYKVIGVDTNSDYISSINNRTLKSSEPRVNELLNSTKNLIATNDPSLLKNSTDVVYIFVATPSLPSGGYDHSQVVNCINSLTKLLDDRDVDIVIGCTVMPGFCDKIKSTTHHNIIYSPMFIAQGDIIKGIEYPDMAIVGSYSRSSFSKIKDIYMSICKNKTAIHDLTPIEAEITKLSLNCFITTKIAYANMIGDIAIRSGASPDRILSAVGTDTRVGSKCLNYGFGFGGPCFPRDNRALAIHASSVGLQAGISIASDKENNAHLDFMIQESLKKYPIGSTITMDYVTYKSNSVLLEESHRLKYAKAMKSLGREVVILDTREEVVSNTKEFYK